MSMNSEIELVRDVNATIIPAGDEQVLEAGTKATVSQALGGSVTIRTDRGLYRIAGKDLDALGDSVKDSIIVTDDSDKNMSKNQPFSEDLIWEAMKGCFDPEIPVNVVDLGLIYDLNVSQDESGKGTRSVQVKMTLTAQGCGMGPVIAEDVKNSIESLDCISEANVEIVWDPPWTPHMISDDGRKKLGIE